MKLSESTGNASLTAFCFLLPYRHLYGSWLVFVKFLWAVVLVIRYNGLSTREATCTRARSGGHQRTGHATHRAIALKHRRRKWETKAPHTGPRRKPGECNFTEGGGRRGLQRFHPARSPS